jgi:hypothetical protein
MARRPSQFNAGTPQTPQVSQDEIAREAFRIFQSRNGAPGDPVADWFAAEKTVRSKTLANGARSAQASAAAGGGGRNANRRNRRRGR